MTGIKTIKLVTTQ